MISIESTNIPDENWDHRLLNSPFGNIFQTTKLAEYYQEAKGWIPYYLKFTDDDGSVVAQLMMSGVYRFNKKNTLHKILKKIPKTKHILFKWIRGPVIFNMNYEKIIYKKLEEYFLSKNCTVSGFAHPLSPDHYSTFEKPFSLEEWATFVINLEQNEETILKNMDKHSCRKNIERSKKKGVYIKQLTKTELSNLYKIRNDPINEKSSLDYSTFELRWNKLHSLGFTGFLAYVDNEPIGGIMISHFNSQINEIGVIRTTKDRQEKLYSQDYLKWSIIQWGKSNNMKYYDLTGVNPNPKTSKEIGIFRYKKKWGGNLIKYNFLKLQ